MKESDFASFKKKTGYREPQKVTTYYKEAKAEKEGIEHHKERAAQNRDKRSLPGHIEQKLTGSTRLTTAARQTGGRIREKGHAAKEKVAGPARVVARAVQPFAQDFGAVFGRNPSTRVVPDYGFRMELPNVSPHTMMMGPWGPIVQRREPSHGKQKKHKGVRHEPGTTHWEELGGIPEDVKRWMM